MFTFPIPSVRVVIERGQSDAAANGGFRNPYYGLKPGQGERSGLWLVGDNGVYIMSNGKLAEGGRPARRLLRGMPPRRHPRLVRLQAPTLRR